MARKDYIKVVLTTSEKAAIEAKAELAGKSASSFLRDLALSDSHTQVNHDQNNGQQSRLDRLESVVLELQQQVAKLAGGYDQENGQSESVCVKWKEGDLITAQYGKCYDLLHHSPKVEQEVRSGLKSQKLKYLWAQELGLVCTLYGRSRSNRPKYRIMWVLEPGQDLSLTPEGGFIHPDGLIYPVEDLQEDTQMDGQEDGHEAEQVDSEATAPESDQPVAQSSDQEDDQALELSLEELAARLSKDKAKVPASTLMTIGGKLKTPEKQDQVLDWTSARDPEELGWLPVDSDRTLWKSQKVNHKDDQQVDQQKPSLVQS